MKRLLILCLAIIPLAACSWGIKLDAGGKKVRTAWNDNVTGCREVGKVTVSVLDRIGPMDRRDLKVRDELEVMARNEAGKMDADTIRPLGEPRDGEQSFTSYVCGRNRPADSVAPRGRDPLTPPSNPAGPTETFPIKNN